MNADDGSLIAVIADEDTVTGFLLAGVGHVDERQRSNYVIVSDKTSKGEIAEAFKDFTTREDIAVVLITQVVRRDGWEICVRARVFDGVVCARSSWKAREAKTDPGARASTSQVADRVRYLLDAHTAAIPSVLEIPDKENPYDPSKDSVLSRVQHLLGGES
jgi:V-type H+-transporting ATPase subunit F